MLQWEAGREQSWDTMGMLKQGHQSHRDLNLSELALQSRRIGATGRFHISPDNTASALR